MLGRIFSACNRLPCTARSLSSLCETAPTPAGRRVLARSAYLHISYIVHASATCTDTRAHASECRVRRIHLGDFSARTPARVLRSHARSNTRSSEFACAYIRTGDRVCASKVYAALRGWREEKGGEYFVRFRSTGCNGGEPHCWPVSRPRLLGRQRRRRRRWWRRWWSRRTSCRRTACLKGRAVLLAASTHTIPPRAIRFACHRGERGVNFNAITPGHRASRG